MPESFDGKNLTLLFDPEFDRSDLEQILSEQSVIETCLNRIRNLKNAKLIIKTANEAISPYETIKMHPKNLEMRKEKAQSNPFVSKIIKTFNGKIIDVWD